MVVRLDQLDNGVFAENVTRWLDRTGGRQVRRTTGHGEQTASSHLADRSSPINDGYNFQTLSAPLSLANLDGVSVLIIDHAKQSFTSAEIEAVRQFVASGGGLWLTGLGWSWEPNHPDTTNSAQRGRESFWSYVSLSGWAFGRKRLPTPSAPARFVVCLPR